MNAVHLSGKVSDYGPKLTYSEAGKPQTTFTLIVEEPGPTGTFKTFVPVVLVGAQAEHWAETLDAGDLVALSGKLQFKGGKTKEGGRLVVTGFTVERLMPPA